MAREAGRRIIAGIDSVFTVLLLKLLHKKYILPILEKNVSLVDKDDTLLPDLKQWNSTVVFFVLYAVISVLAIVALLMPKKVGIERTLKLVQFWMTINFLSCCLSARILIVSVIGRFVKADPTASFYIYFFSFFLVVRVCLTYVMWNEMKYVQSQVNYLKRSRNVLNNNMQMKNLNLPETKSGIKFAGQNISVVAPGGILLPIRAYQDDMQASDCQCLCPQNV